ncbi:separin isoform X2 [Pieris brassicae]|uniref:separin isoform X2 n=1 Tax=Pieris brassicae TaxID=7116 RepID=UPI001E65E923|nr:separin isoform X2 [Pieris brassicae]
MEDFDIFDENEFEAPVYKKILNEFMESMPPMPCSANYQSGRRLNGEECLVENKEDYGFHFSESVSVAVRSLAVYRDDQQNVTSTDPGIDALKLMYLFTKSIHKISPTPLKKEDKYLEEFLKDVGCESHISSIQENLEMPFHKKYIRFGTHNNVKNLLMILDELPKEWTVIQLTSRYNPEENVKPFDEFKTDISSIFITMFTNDYVDKPMSVLIPANVTKEGEQPLFKELYSLLDDNFKTIESAQYLNNKRLIKNYWSKRDDIDLRMKGVLNMMDKEWLGGWCSLLMGKLVDSKLKNKIIHYVDSAICDWGFIKLTNKQKILLYNLMDCSPVLSSQQIKSCIRQILTEHGDTEELRTFKRDIKCLDCDSDFRFSSELCLKCLSKCFEEIHKFSVVDGIKAFSQVAMKIKDDLDFRETKRHPVILIVDELLDSFPWESLPALNPHPITRMENIHFLYFLYKTHEDSIVDGYFLTKSEVGRYVINPDKDLQRMQLRMQSFIEYWCGEWKGRVAEPPAPGELLEYLNAADIFLYCGHGDGVGAVCSGSGVCRGRCVCVLSGCGSVRLSGASGRAPPAAPHQHLHVAGCPCVVGMLWEVTDLEVDKVVSTLVALSVSSKAPLDWKCVGKTKWSQGEIDTNVEQKPRSSPEKNLLLAISKARQATNYLMISTSIVSRGLPVKIIDTP